MGEEFYVLSDLCCGQSYRQIEVFHFLFFGLTVHEWVTNVDQSSVGGKEEDLLCNGED